MGEGDGHGDGERGKTFQCGEVKPQLGLNGEQRTPIIGDVQHKLLFDRKTGRTPHR
jgi:hypothetical protein